MSHIVWRIATDTADDEADDLAGEGAKRTGGRWNEKGVAVVYASETRALACLETVVCLNAGGLPLNRYLVEVAIPDHVWATAQSENASSLAVGWDAEPAGRASIRFGSGWLRSGNSAVLMVPSAVVLEEFNVLINPHHPDSSATLITRTVPQLPRPRFASGFTIRG